MEKLNQILAAYVATGGETQEKVLGVAFIVCDKDGILYQGSAGRVDIGKDSSKFSADTFTWVASMTKIITAACIMGFVERGRLKLDDDARIVVPELGQFQILKGFSQEGKAILEDNTKSITLRHLLTHSAGIGYDLADPELLRWSESIGRTANNLQHTLEGWSVPLKFPPGEGWFYGGAVDWAGQVLERVTGVKLSDLMAEHIFQPLSMNDTTFFRETLASLVAGRTAPCTMRDSETGRLAVVPTPVPAVPPVVSGGAGLYMTAADHAKLLQSLLQSSAGSQGLLCKDTVDEMFRPQLNEPQRQMLEARARQSHESMVPEFAPEMPLDHGISGIINLEDSPGKRRRGSMTWLGMCNSHWWIDRESGIAATLFVNVMPLPDEVVIRLYDELERAVYGDLLPSLGR